MGDCESMAGLTRGEYACNMEQTRLCNVDRLSPSPARSLTVDAGQSFRYGRMEKREADFTQVPGRRGVADDVLSLTLSLPKRL